MKVMVTGSDGYIGSVLVPFLLEKGFDVAGMDTGYYALGQLGCSSPCPVKVKDIRHVEPADVTGFDAVVHLAELSNDPLGHLSPELTYQINLKGSVRLARLCREAGVKRFLHSSSTSVYGIASSAPCTETSPVHPQSEYARCKWLTEQALEELAAPGFSPVILRNATAFGPSPNMRFDLVLNNLAGLAWTRGEIAMTSDGTPWRPMVHVMDISRAVATALLAPVERIHNQIFNVGDDRQNHQVRELAAIVAAVFPGCRVTTGPASGDNRSYRVDFSKIAGQLGFRCRNSVEDGARQLREMFTCVGLTPAAFSMTPFTRLHQIESLIRSGKLDAELFWRTPAVAPRSEAATV
ncbi:MAG: SDR family oxidoreductase [Acidimicrobiia bacterium]|nr:SDR family oxidoreductase [Acidimicrobiia bacterium]